MDAVKLRARRESRAKRFLFGSDRVRRATVLARRLDAYRASFSRSRSSDDVPVDVIELLFSPW